MDKCVINFVSAQNFFLNFVTCFQRTGAEDEQTRSLSKICLSNRQNSDIYGDEYYLVQYPGTWYRYLVQVYLEQYIERSNSLQPAKINASSF